MAKKTEKKASAKKVEATPPPPPLPSVFVLTKSAANILWQYRVLFAGVIAIYGFLNVFLAQALSGDGDISGMKHTLDQTIGGGFGEVGASFSVFVHIVGTAGNGAGQTASAYQVALTLISSLAVIWALRQVYTGTLPRVRDTFYRGMYPLVPFILMLLIITLEMIPLLIGASMYSLVTTTGIAAHIVERLVFAGIYAGLASITIYWLTSSVIALYVVTLPDMTPIKALRSASGLVKGRRWPVMRKLLFLPLMLLVVAVVIMLPIIIVYAPLAKFVYFILTMLGLLAIHSYIYALYRELLNE